MKNKISISFLKLFTFIAMMLCISTNVFAQKDMGSIAINGGNFSNSTFTFPNTKDHDFSVKAEGNQRSITMHNNIKSGKYVDDIMVSILVPEKGVGEYKFTKETNQDEISLTVTLVRNLNDNAVYNHSIQATEGVIEITSEEGKTISGTFEVNGEELDLTTMATIKYTLKGNFNTVKIN